MLVVAVGALWPVREVPWFAFVDFDDPINIVLHPRLGPPTAELVQWAWTDADYMRRYVPLGWLGFSAVYGVAGLAPWGYHAAGVALHAGNALLVFAVLGALLRRGAAECGAGGTAERGGSDGGDSGETWRVTVAALGALAWAVHPLRAETVGWASGLLYAQAGALALAAVWAYLRMPAAGRGRAMWLAVAGGLHAASLLTYPVALGLTGVLVGIDFLVTRRGRTGGGAGASASAGADEPGESGKSGGKKTQGGGGGEGGAGAAAPGWGRLAAEKLVFAVPAAAVLAVTWWARQQAGAFWESAPGLEEFGIGERVRQAVEGWAHYTVAPLWPAGLTPVPTWLATAEGWSGRAVAGAFVLAVLTGAAVRAAWLGRPAGAVLWGAHLALLVPLVGWTERPYFPSDRYHYLAGVVWIAGAVALLVRVPGRVRGAAVTVGSVVVIGLAWAQAGQLEHWRDTDALMARVLTHAEVPAARAEYAARWVAFHANRGHAARAEALARGLGVTWKTGYGEVKPGVPVAASVHLRLAIEARRDGRQVPAREHLAEALRLAPAWDEAVFQAAVLAAEEGDWAEAWRSFRRLGGAIGASGETGASAVPEAARRQLARAIAEGFRAAGRENAARGVERWLEGGR